MPGRSSLPRDGQPPRAPCRRWIEDKGRYCRAKAEPGDMNCRYHGGRAPSHQAKKEERINDYRDQLMEMADFALDTVMAKLTSRNEAVALRAALEIMDRAGVSTVRKSETTQTTIQKSELDLQIEKLLKEKHPDSEAAQQVDESVTVTPSRHTPGTNINSDKRDFTPEDFAGGGGGGGFGLSSTDLPDVDLDRGDEPPAPPF